VAPVSNKRDQGRENPIQVLAKAVAVLDVLEADGELTAAQIAEHLNEPRSSVYRLLASLQGVGFVDPGDRRGTFRLGMRLYGLGNSAIRQRDLREAALPQMIELRERTHNTVFLAVRSGYEALCIERVVGRWTISNVLMPGTTVPLHVGAVGKVLLAAEPEEFWQRYLDEAEMVVFTPHTVSEREELLRVLAEVRDTGVAISDEDRLLGMAGVGAPVRDHDARVCGAISFSGPKPGVLEDQRAESIELIKQAASHVSRSLGYGSGVSGGAPSLSAG
jgi:DNA-binding IclR family transcriptional regulator